jgi:hypothetical protein
MSILRREGAAARFVEAHGWRQTAWNLIWSYFSAMKLLPHALRKRHTIQRTKRLSTRETIQLIRRFQIDVRELTSRD